MIEGLGNVNKLGLKFEVQMCFPSQRKAKVYKKRHIIRFDNHVPFELNDANKKYLLAELSRWAVANIPEVSDIVLSYEWDKKLGSIKVPWEIDGNDYSWYYLVSEGESEIQAVLMITICIYEKKRWKDIRIQ